MKTGFHQPSSSRHGFLRLTLPFIASALAVCAQAEPDKEVAIRVWRQVPDSGELVLIGQPGGRPVTVPASASVNFNEPTLVRRDISLEVRWQDESGKTTVGPAVSLPANGSDFVMLLHGESQATARALLIPSDLGSFGWGSALFVNLSAHRLRCSLSGEAVELPPGETARCPLTLRSRKVVLLRIEHQDGGKWITDSANPVILTGGIRAIFAVGGDARKARLLTYSGFESDPMLTQPPKPVEPAVTPAEPPLPDPPTK